MNAASIPIAITITSALANSTAYGTAANYQQVPISEESEALQMDVWADTSSGSARLRLIWTDGTLLYRVADATATVLSASGTDARQAVAGNSGLYKCSLVWDDTGTNKIDLLPRSTCRLLVLRLGSQTAFTTITTLTAYCSGSTKI